MKDLVGNSEGGFIDPETNLYNCGKLQFVRNKFVEFESYKTFATSYVTLQQTQQQQQTQPQREGSEDNKLAKLLSELVAVEEADLWELV